MASPPFPSWTSVTFVAMHLDHTGCWIGFEDSAASGGFIWTDGTFVDYSNWNSGEPNDRNGSAAGGANCGAATDDAGNEDCT